MSVPPLRSNRGQFDYGTVSQQDLEVKENPLRGRDSIDENQNDESPGFLGRIRAFFRKKQPSEKTPLKTE